jgi:non-canonical purine NTP pyrophosphatase (RdgB/HAM1 family)
MNNKIAYVTTNTGKFKDVHDFCAIHAPDITLEQVPIEIEEIQSIDQKAIAIDKVKKAWEIAKRPLLIDDAAIYFERYNKFPGTLSKFVFKGIGFEGIKRLIDEGDKAFFLLYLVYITGPDEIYIFEGRADGILTKPDVFDATPELPFDTFFIPNGSTKTYSKLRGTSEWHKYFYRLCAFKKFIAWYNLQ